MDEQKINEMMTKMLAELEEKYPPTNEYNKGFSAGYQLAMAHVKGTIEGRYGK